jgi:predicted nucleic acid-binding protein
MMLLDTNVLSEPMRLKPSIKVINWLDEQFISELYISSITKAEIELGLALLPAGKRKQRLFSAAHEMLKKFSGRCLPFGENEASIYARIVADSRKKGKNVTVEDGQIAAVALCNNLYLATRNVKDFEMIDSLKIINPFI